MKAIKVITVFASVLILALSARAQIAPGTVLSVRLDSTLSLNAKAGQTIVGRIMQDVPQTQAETIHRGAKVIGHVTAVRPASSGSRISLRFDRLVWGHRQIPIATNLRALASFVEVEEAQLPDTGTDRGTPLDDWTTNLIGGDVSYRGGGPVTEGAEVVGQPTYDGVLSQLYPASAGGCRGAISGNDMPQALWVFSADACGVYGFPGLRIVHAGRSDPVGEIALTSNGARLKVPSGSGLLLRVIGSGNSTT